MINISSSLEEEELSSLYNDWLFSWIWIAFIWFILIIIISTFIFRYLDIRKRVYQVYDDSIFYSEWFLSKNYSFIPMEKIADTENSQSFLSKVFGIHDVIVSSEWTNNQMYFFNIVNGKKMMENIKYLKNNISMSATKKVEVNSNISESSNKIEETIQEKLNNNNNLNYNETLITSYSPNMVKVFLWNYFFYFL